MEILGLLDTLESMILDSPKIPLSKKAVVDENKLLAIIDKIRLVASSSGDIAKQAITTYKKAPDPQEIQKPEDDSVKYIVNKAITDIKEASPELKEKAADIIEQAYQIAREIRSGADKYADEVLANLEVTSNRVLRQIRHGRSKISKFLNESSSVGNPEKTAKE